LLTLDDRRPDDPAHAVALLGRAAELIPKDPRAWFLIGLIHYRSGDDEAARTALEEAMQVRPGGGPGDWLLMALIDWRGGRSASAREWHDKAIAWFETHPRRSPGMNRLRAEAEAAFELPSRPFADDGPRGARD
jgi:tetratricopeptide (TPR) repeat protein